MTTRSRNNASLRRGELQPGGAYLLTWNPARWNRWDPKQEANAVRRGKPTLLEWSTGSTRCVKVGSPFLFLRQGREQPGLIGWGRIRSQVYPRPHWDTAKRTKGQESYEVRIHFEFLCEPGGGDEVAFETLSTDRRTRDGNWSAQASGTRLAASVVDGVRQLWAERKIQLPSFRSLKPVTQVPSPAILEGAKKARWLTYHERNITARRLCVQHFGAVCQGCGFESELSYGPLVAGMIEVHHLHPISQAGGHRKVDPAKDLVPLCPNCHRVVHINRDEPLSLKELRHMIQSAAEQRTTTKKRHLRRRVT